MLRVFSISKSSTPTAARATAASVILSIAAPIIAPVACIPLLPSMALPMEPDYVGPDCAYVRRRRERAP